LTLLLIISVIRGSHQRPQLAEDVLTSTTPTTTTTTEATTKESAKRSTVDKTSQVTEATAVETAVSVRTTVNVTSSSSSSSLSPSNYIPREVFEDFEPSNYYEPDGEPKFEKPSPQVVREVFRQPEYFWRPDDQTLRNAPSPKSNGTRNVVFPQPTPTTTIQRHNHFERHRFDGQTDESSHKSPHASSADVSFRSKPAKHDSGEFLPPDFGGAYHDGGDFYERVYFGGSQHSGHEMSPYHRPDVLHAPLKSYHGVGLTTTRHKK